MSGHHKNDDPIELHDQQLQYLEHRYIEHVNENESCRRPPSGKCNMPRVLPVRALNEVFMGESLSSRYVYHICPSKGTVCISIPNSIYFF